VLLLPPQREEARRSALHPSSLYARTANACRTARAFVTLPPLVSPPTRKREDAGAPPSSPSQHSHTSNRHAKAAVIRGGKEEGPTVLTGRRGYDLVTGPAIRFRPELATHRRANALEARSFAANGLPCGASLLLDLLCFRREQRGAYINKRLKQLRERVGLHEHRLVRPARPLWLSARQGEYTSAFAGHQATHADRKRRPAGTAR
jgi:hypothetical protein